MIAKRRATCGPRRRWTTGSGSEANAMRLLLVLLLGTASSAAAAALCNLNGNWSVTKKVVVHGLVEHIEFFQQPHNATFTLRTTDWKSSLSHGSVLDATRVSILMVGGGMETFYINSACDQLSQQPGGASTWCRFPHCPFAEPKSWPPWSPPKPPPPTPAPHLPERRTTCGGGYGWGSNGPPCPDPTWCVPPSLQPPCSVTRWRLVKRTDSDAGYVRPAAQGAELGAEHVDADSVTRSANRVRYRSGGSLGAGYV
jgi:hypothetical protein